MLTYRMSKFLKERRKELGKELKEIACITRIKGAYLKSIEEEEFDKLPVEVYTRGYIREYAELLGIPCDIALEPYENYIRDKKTGKGNDTSDENASVILTREVLDNHDVHKEGSDLEHMDLLLSRELTSRSSNKTSFFKILWILPAIIAVGGTYLFVSFLINAPQVNEQVVSSPQTSYPQEALNPQPPQAPSLAPDSNAGANVPGEPEATVPEDVPQLQKNTKDKAPAVPVTTQPMDGKNRALKWKHTISINATDKVWIRLLIDGTENKEMLLNKGDKVSYGADKSIAVTVGNAAGANIRFDGEPFENLGAKGEVVKFNFPVSSAQHPAAGEKDSNAASDEPSAPLPSVEGSDTR